MTAIKAIQTEYNGHIFRSRLEARWAVFFDACGARWDYELEGYDLGYDIKYLPDFFLRNVKGIDGGKLYVEVKGEITGSDVIKIKLFERLGMHKENVVNKRDSPILVLTSIPKGDEISEIAWHIRQAGIDQISSNQRLLMMPFFFGHIDDTLDIAMPGVNINGEFEIFRLDFDLNPIENMDIVRTERAYRLARQARFEFGETPKII